MLRSFSRIMVGSFLGSMIYPAMVLGLNKSSKYEFCLVELALCPIISGSYHTTSTTISLVGAG